MGTDMMVWNVTKDEISERMAVAPEDAWGVPGTAKQPPPQRGLPDPMSDFIKKGKWREGYDAANDMLDAHMKKYGLEKQDWRNGYWDE
jgi:ribonuclease Z